MNSRLPEIKQSRLLFPFAAVEGQDDMKLSLILNAIDPNIGGVLIRGEKGTAKSTTVRALAEILPQIEVRKGCHYGSIQGCSFCQTCASFSDESEMRRVRVETLPLNSTEDMIAGSIDFESAIKSGKKVFQPGLLARVNRGILYIDEVNLLDDHIVDIILDSSSSGINIIEREGISYSHPCSFMLVGTMNPEEGDLRPQFIDRFGLCVNVAGSRDIAERIRLMKLREEFDTKPHAFIAKYSGENESIADDILAARRNLPSVTISKTLKKYISELCLSRNVAGHRADIILKRAAKALSAYKGKKEVTVDEILAVAEMVLVHRTRESHNQTPPPPEPPENNEDDQDNQEQDENPDMPEQDNGETEEEDDEDEGEDESPEEEMNQEQNEQQDQPDESEGENDRMPDMSPPPPSNDDNDNVKEEVFSIGETFKVKKISIARDRVERRGSGRRSRTKTGQKQGRYMRSVFSKRESSDIAFDATIRAAAPFQKHRKRSNDVLISIKKEDIRIKEREKKIGNLILFTVDASGSMGAKGRMAASKGAVMSLLLDAYQKRDRVGLVTFRKKEAEVLLPPTSSVDMAAGKLREMPVGGRTPLSVGLAKGYEILSANLIKDPSMRPVMILMTDGRSNYAVGNGKPMDEVFEYADKMSRESRIKYIVIDTEEAGAVTFGLARKLSDHLGAEYFKIEDLKASDILGVINRSNKNG